MDGSRETGVLGAGEAGAGQPSRRSNTLLVPGEDHEIPAEYAFTPLAKARASHDGLTFQPNDGYELKNERQYADPVNQQRILDQERRFNSRFLVTEKPIKVNWSCSGASLN